MRERRPEGTGPLWLRALLRVYPRSFRDDHAVEVAEHVRIERERSKGQSRWRRVPGAIGMVIDIGRAGLRARRRSRYEAGREPTRAMSSRGADHAADLFVSLWQAARSLSRSPLLAITVIVTVAVGIGLSTSVFSVVNAVVLRPLEYRKPDRLVRVLTTLSGQADVSMAGGTLEKLRQRTKAFSDLAGIATIRQNMTGTAVPRQVEVGWTSEDFFDVLGVRAALGRTYVEGDPMGTAMLSDETWQRDFGSDPGVIGRSMELDGSSYTIVGVLPAGFHLHLGPIPQTIDVWKVPDDWWQNGNVWSAEGTEFGLLDVVGRLSDGVDIDRATSDLDRLAAGLRDEVPQYRIESFGLTAVPLQRHVVSRARPLVSLLMAAVLAVMLIVCANVVSLLLVRAEDRSHEIAVRLAIGSGRRRIVSHLMWESVVLAGVGGMLGLALAYAGAKVLPMLAPSDVPRLADVSLDRTVLAFGLTVSVVCTVLFGLAPALTVARRGTRSVLGSVRATVSSGIARSALVAGQIGASMALLVAAWLFAASTNHLESVEPGFDARDVLTFAVSLPGKRYDWPVGASRFYQRLADRIEEMPGVESAAMLWPLPLAGHNWNGPVRGGRLDSDRMNARYVLNTPGVFETLRIPLVEGRTFRESDPRQTVLVSRSLAAKAWPGESALGREIRAFPWGRDTTAFRVIGVVDDVRFDSLRDPPSDVVYFANSSWVWTDWEVNFVVRSSIDRASLTQAIRSAVSAMDPLIPVADIHPLDANLAAETATVRFARVLFGVFAAVSVFLAVLGLYGVIAWGVRRRFREFGIRLALGSSEVRILALVMRTGLTVTAVGVGAGAVAAVWTSGLLRGSLFGVPPTDPVAYMIAGGGLALAAGAASIVPALRATRLDPATVMRSD